MNTKTLVVGGVAAGGGGAAILLRRLMGTDGQAQTRSDRWHAVTINRPQQEVLSDGGLPAPLAELGDKIDVQVRPAPGNRGTELLARLRGPVPTGLPGTAAKLAGEDPRQPLRKALRQSKMLIETGEILSPDKPPTARRTLKNLPLELAVRRSREEGRL